MFQARNFLRDKFQKPSNVVTLCKAYGFSLGEAAVEKWWQRDRIPGDWLPVLIAVLELEKGQPVRLARYIVAGAEK